MIGDLKPAQVLHAEARWNWGQGHLCGSGRIRTLICSYRNTCDFHLCSPGSRPGRHLWRSKSPGYSTKKAEKNCTPDHQATPQRPTRLSNPTGAVTSVHSGSPAPLLEDECTSYQGKSAQTGRQQLP